MAGGVDPATLKAKNLCYRCIGEAYLRAEVQREGRRRHCSYCDRTGKSYTIGEMAERIEQVFEEHFVRTSDQPNSWQQTLLSDRESDYDWERDGEPVVQAVAGAADMPEEAADSAAMGEETEFSSDSYYEERGTGDRAWQEEWREFERALKTEARFFSRTAAAHLGSIFRGISQKLLARPRP